MNLTPYLVAIREAERHFLASPIANANSFLVIAKFYKREQARPIVLAALHASRRMLAEILENHFRSSDAV